MATLSDIYQPQVEAFKKSVDGLDPILGDHRKAMDARDAEELVQLGLLIYSVLLRWDEATRTAATRGARVSDDEWDDIEKQFDLWLDAAARVLTRAQRSAELGYAVPRLQEFLDTVRKCEAAKHDRLYAG